MNKTSLFKGITTTIIFSLIIAMIVSPSYFGIVNNVSATSNGSDKAGSLNQVSSPGKGVIQTVQTSSSSVNTVQVSSSVTVSQISSSPSTAQSSVQSSVKTIPFHAGPASIGPQTSSKASVNIVPITVQQPSSSSAAPLIANQYSGFEGSDYPASCFCTPPDGNVAVGPSNIMQEVNSEAKIWSKSGTPLATYNIATFFGTGSLFISDPRVVYDAQSGHWFSTILATDNTNPGVVKVAVSMTGNPTGGWWIYTLGFAGVTPDQPRLAVTDDKVTLVASNYPASGGWFGDQIIVLNKSEMIVGGSTSFVSFGPDNTRFHVEPAIYPVAGVADQWFVQDGAGGATGAEYLKITGLPGVTAVSYTSMFTTPIATTSGPPGGAQPSTSTLVATNDARILSASMRGGIITWTANDGCVPANGDGSTHSCARWDIADTSGVLHQDIDFGSSQKDIYFPAVSQAGSTDFGLIFDFSSKTEYPSIGFTGQSASEPYNTVDNPVLVKAGTGPDTTGRHGDYHAVRADPSTGIYYSEAEYNTQALPWNTFISVNQISAGSNIVHSTTLTLNPITNVPWGTTVKVTGKLVDSSASNIGVGGQPITFTSSAGTIQSTVTAADGTFSTTGTAPGAPPVSVNVQAFYAGTQFFSSSSSSVTTYSTLRHTSQIFQYPISNAPWNGTLSIRVFVTDVTSGNIPIAGKTITWTGTGVGGISSAVTGALGTAVGTGIAPGTVNTGWNSTAHFAGDTNYTPSKSNTNTFDTLSHTTLLVFSTIKSPVPHGTATSFPLVLVDLDNGGTPVTFRTITFSGTGAIGVGSQITDSFGAATGTGTAPSTVASGWTIKGSFAGNTNYAASSTIVRTYATS